MIVTKTPLRSLAARLIANVTSQVGPPAEKWSRGTPRVMQVNSLSGHAWTLTTVGLCGRALDDGPVDGKAPGAVEGPPEAPEDAAGEAGATDPVEPSVAAGLATAAGVDEAGLPGDAAAAEATGGYDQPPVDALLQAARTATTASAATTTATRATTPAGR